MNPRYKITEEISENLKNVEKAKPSRVFVDSILTRLEEEGGAAGGEAENYRNILAYIADFVSKKKEITSQTLLEIHRIATLGALRRGEPGSFRISKSGVFLWTDGQITRVNYVGPDFQKVPELVEEVVDWVKKALTDGTHPTIVAGVALCGILAIHPFLDGNGRVARALATLILFRQGYDFSKFFALEDYFNLDREAYCNALDKLGKKYDERRKADLTSWLEYFMEGLRYLYSS